MQKNSITDEYLPAEDTYLLADYIENVSGEYALDVGSGSGYLTQILEKNFKFVIGTDINFSVLKDQTFPAKNLVCCNGGDAIYTKFDLIICNLPYLATDDILDVATDGGKEGFDIPRQIFDSVFPLMAKKGKFIFVTSSLSNYKKLIDYAQNFGFKTDIIGKKKLFFEELILVSVKN